jgi:myo-inositol 2-dehydrogenase/D-chiro-inositol 1-dehydrogenase
MKRRSFLSVSGAAAGSLLGQTSGDRVATAMIGTGNRGSYVLQGILEQAAAKDNPKTYSDWRQIIDRKDIGAVFIATPPHLHSDMAIAALKAGKHVYCEKPIGVTAEQVRNLVRAAKASSKVFVAGQQLRSHQQMREAITKIREGAIGDVIMVKAQRHASSDLDHKGSSADWYFDVTKSGGYLIEQSVHNLDVCNWVIGAHPTHATGFGAIMLYKDDPPGRTIFDCGSITYEYPNGVMMSFTQNVFHPRGMPAGNQYVFVYGKKAAVDLMYSTNVYPLQAGEGAKPLAAAQKEPPHAHTTAFYDAILNGRPSPADITIGATAALTAILGHEAMVKQSTVKWSDLGVTL